ncbi:hypothetical protein PRZ48_015086 [Zasmidium cellare]|uniref:Uncharacterized protein n=1 Tax=Zasmidium cellare TaxID=395010 RepID=A0ABR0DY85_ZASCE|nr:hypothetical protein PRZ48_015086 [Zasmidium cellare]
MAPLLAQNRMLKAIILLTLALAAILTSTLNTSHPPPLIESRDLTPTTNTTLTPRTTDWNSHLYHGNWLLCLLSAPTRTITQSPWIIHNALTLQGWTSTKQRTLSQDALSSLGLDDAFTALGISTDYTKWFTVTATHDTNKPPYRATWGKYLNTFNPSDGVIVARHNYSPAWQAARKGVPRQFVPALRQWSDVVFLVWMKLAGSDREVLRGVEHVFRYNIANRETQRILQLAMGEGDVGRAPETPGEWPGSQWNIDEDSAKVALSTRNSVGVVYFLAQHKEQLGLKTIDQVNIFNCKTGPSNQWCLYFHIVDKAA